MRGIVNKRKRKLTRLLDGVVHGLCAPVLFFPRPKKSREAVRKILAVQFAYIGDVVMTLPALRALKESYPEAEITFLVGSGARAVVENNPFIDEILVFDPPWFSSQNHGLGEYLRLMRELRAKRFDLAVDFRGDFRNILFVLFPSRARRRVACGQRGGAYLLTDAVTFTGKKHFVDYHVDLIRAVGHPAAVPGTMNLHPTIQEKDRVLNLLETAGFEGAERLVALHPGGRVACKCWDLTAFAVLADALIKHYNARVCITGAEKERAEAERLMEQMEGKALNLCGNLNVRELQALYGRVDLVVTNDTAALHVASGANTPIVAIFGPSEPWETGPRSDDFRVVMRDMACRSGCDFNCTFERKVACLRDLSPEEVFSACAELLEKKKRKRCVALPSRDGKDEEKTWTTSTGCSS